MVRLARDQYGHMVVLTMLEMFRHKQIHNTLRTAILVRQVEVAGTEFGRKLIKNMKTKCSSLTGLWVVLLFGVNCYHSRKLRGNFGFLRVVWMILGIFCHLLQQ
jgi:hypothetical protein